MRYTEIMELAGVKQFDDMTVTEIVNHIKNNFCDGPIKLLGQGVSGVAVQIGLNVYKFWMIDSAYTLFVEYCLNNSHNPFLPKFHSKIKRMRSFFLKHEQAPDHVNYVKMEKLIEPNDLIMSTTFELTGITFSSDEEEDENGHLAYISLRDIIYHVENMPNAVIPPAMNFMQRLNDKRNYNYKTSELSPQLSQLVTTLVDIKNMNHHMDLHPKNLMTRQDGQLVIMDPICNKNDMALNYQFSKFDANIRSQ